jgi:hypothetical protein
MLSKGRRPADATRVVIVDDVSGADVRQTGSLLADRYVVPAFGATHSYLEIQPTQWGLQLHMLTAVNTPVQLSSHTGAGAANRLEVLPEANGNVSQFPFRTGNLGAFPGPEFAGWTPPRVMPYRIFRGSCGQLGPVILPNARALEVSPPVDARAFETHWFNPPLVFLGPALFIAQLANVALDLSFVLEIPMRGPQEAEGV